MRFDKNKLDELSRPMSAKELKELESLRDNKEWLDISERLALKIRRILRTEGISQVEFAHKMEVSPAQITKILSGKENLGIKTISRIEKALGHTLVEVSIDENKGYIGLDTNTPLKIHQSAKCVKRSAFSSVVAHNILS